MKRLPCMKRQRDPTTSVIAVDAMTSALAANAKPEPFHGSGHLCRRNAGETRTHTAISNVVSAAAERLGIASPPVKRSSTCNCMASRMFARASSYESPCE